MKKPKRHTVERRRELAERRQKQWEAEPTKELTFCGKYIPADIHKTTQPHNR